jgi:hypothetical protein
VIINSAGLGTYDTANDINILQDLVDYSFTNDSLGIHVARELVPVSRLDAYVSGHYGSIAAATSPASPGTTDSTLSQLTAEISVVAGQSKVTPATGLALARSYRILTHALGTNPNTMPGPGGTMRDPLVVYYDAQVGNF